MSACPDNFKPGDLIKIWQWCPENGVAGRTVGLVIGEATSVHGLLEVRPRIWVLISESGQFVTRIQFVGDVEHFRLPKFITPVQNSASL